MQWIQDDEEAQLEEQEHAEQAPDDTRSRYLEQEAEEAEEAEEPEEPEDAEDAMSDGESAAGADRMDVFRE
jgi:hypothetical protein